MCENDFIIDSKRVREWLGSFKECNEFKGVKNNENMIIKTLFTNKTSDHAHVLIKTEMIE